MSYRIKGQGIFKKFGENVVFQDLNFDFAPGIHCVFGSNGQGKSTLLRILCGADRQYEGALQLEGEKVLDAKASPETANLIRSYVPDTPSFYPKTTTAEFLNFIRLLRKAKEDDLEKTVRHFEIKELLDQRLENQSLGQRKRSFFAGTLLPSLPIWILDEPTNGLDENFQELFILWSKAHATAGGTVAIASHDVKLAEKLGAISYHLEKRQATGGVNFLTRI